VVLGQSCGQKCLIDARGQRRMSWLIQADRRATLTEITTCYNRGMQQSICVVTTCTTLRRMGYNSRRPHRDIQMVESEFGVNRMKTWIHHALSPLCRLVVVVWDVFLAHFRPPSANWASFKSHGLPEHCFWPCPSLYGHSSSRIMHHVTKLESFQIDFLNMTMSSLY